MIKEVNKSEVLRLLVDGVKVFRIDIKNLMIFDIGNDRLNNIKRDLGRDEYIYFILDNEETPISVEEKRAYIREFCNKRDRCSKTCPLYTIDIENCYSASPEIVEENYQIIREYERNEPEKVEVVE